MASTMSSQTSTEDVVKWWKALWDAISVPEVHYDGKKPLWQGSRGGWDSAGDVECCGCVVNTLL